MIVFWMLLLISISIKSLFFSLNQGLCVSHAFIKLLENMPITWEQIRDVKVIYHLAGAERSRGLLSPFVWRSGAPCGLWWDARSVNCAIQWLSFSERIVIPRKVFFFFFYMKCSSISKNEFNLCFNFYIIRIQFLYYAQNFFFIGFCKHCILLIFLSFLFLLFKRVFLISILSYYFKMRRWCN